MKSYSYKDCAILGRNIYEKIRKKYVYSLYDNDVRKKANIEKRLEAHTTKR